MKRIIIVVLILIIMPMIAMAELPKDKINSHADMMTRKLKLAPFIDQIKNDKVSSNQTAILYAILQNTHEVYIHQQNGARGNQVFVHKDGHSEAVYDEDGKLVKDGINDGSYNYYHPFKEPLYHFSFDISPWIMWGQSPTDSTTVKSRIYAYMGDLEGGIRRALKKGNRLNGNWKTTGQIHALAVFIRSIHEGGAESLFELFEPGIKITDKHLNYILTKLNNGLNKVYSVPNKAN